MIKTLPAMRETQVQSLGLEDSAGGEHGNPLRYSCLENSTDRRTWRATVLGVTESEPNMTELAAGTHSHDDDRAARMTSILQPGRLCAESGICLAKS